MKSLIAVLAFVALPIVASAQIITLHSSVYASWGKFRNIQKGTSVTETYVITSDPVATVLFPGLSFYTQDADMTATIEGFGDLFTNVHGQLTIQDITGAWGAVATAPHYVYDLASSNDDTVLTADGTFLSSLIDGSQFNLLNSSAYALRFGLDFIGWKIDSIEVSYPSAVPEPGTYGLIGAVALVGLAGYRRLRRKA